MPVTEGAKRAINSKKNRTRKILLEAARRENENKDVTYLMRAFIDAGLYLPTSKYALLSERNRLNYFLVKIGRWEKSGRLVCRKDNGGNRYFKPGEVEQIVEAFSLGGDYYWDYRGEKGRQISAQTRMDKLAVRQNEIAKRIKYSTDKHDNDIIKLHIVKDK